MTELDITPRAGALPVPLAQVTGGSMPGLLVLHEWVAAAKEAETLVAPLVDTAFLPASLWPLPPGVAPRDMPNPRIKHMRESVEEWRGRRQVACSSGTAAVLTGMTLGLDPLVALAQVFVVKGRPGLYTKIKVALAQRAGHDVWDEELTPERVTVCGRRKGWPQDRIVRITLTIEQAEQAGWTTNDTYRKTPADMLWARAAGRVIDRIAADTLNGIPSIETMDDDPEPPAQVTADVSDLPVRTTAAAILARAEQTPPAAEYADQAPRDQEWLRQHAADPFPGPTAPDEPEVTRVVLPASGALMEVIKGLFDGHGIAGRSNADKAARLAVFSRILDRPITTPPDLTTDEAKLVRDNLMGEGGRRLVADVTGRPVDTEAVDPGHLEDAAAVDEATTGDEFDPTTAPGWGTEGRPVEQQ